MDIKEDWKVCCIRFFDKKIASGAEVTSKVGVNVN